MTDERIMQISRVFLRLALSITFRFGRGDAAPSQCTRCLTHIHSA